MVETSGSRHSQHHSPWESWCFQNYMISPVELRQHESLPASVNPYKASINLGLNGSDVHSLSKMGLLHGRNVSITECWPQPQTPFLVPNGHLNSHTTLFSARAALQPPAYGLPSCPQEKKFVIFDQSGDETRLIFSSLCPRMQNLVTAQTQCPVLNLQDVSAPIFGANQFPAEGQQANKAEQLWTKTPIVHEESGENEIVEQGSGVQDDTEEINALLYSDNDYGFDSKYDEDDDQLSTGHSPLAVDRDGVKLEEQEEKDFNEVDSFDLSLKRRKTLDGAHNDLSLLHTTTMSRENPSYVNIHGGDMTCSLGEETGPTIGRKRLRKEKIRDTLRALERIIPGAKNKNPLVILDEAISYLKCLRYSAQVMSLEDPDSSSCCGPSNSVPFTSSIKNRE